jgi:hypothetical protein
MSDHRTLHPQVGHAPHVTGSGGEASRPPANTAARRPWRWLVAVFTTAVMLLGTLGISAVSSKTDYQMGGGAAYLPADAFAYAELRLDLPGDQSDNLMAFLSRFPGFADGASFTTKLDEALEQFFGRSGAPISWTEDIRPWFGGQVTLGVPEVPETDRGLGGGLGPEQPAIVLTLGVTDPAALDATIQKLLPEMRGVEPEEYAGTTIYHDDGTAFAAREDLLLFSNDLDTLKGSLDILAGSAPSLTDDPSFQETIAALPEDRLGAFVLGTRQLQDVLQGMLEGQMNEQGMAVLGPQLELALANMPDHIAGLLRVDEDHITSSILAKLPEGAPALAVRSTDLATKVPSGSLAYLEVRDIGSGIRTFVTQIKGLMAQDEEDARQLEQIEAILGTPLEDYLAWAEDLGIASALSTAGLSIGLVATVTDEETAKTRLASLMSLIRAVNASRDPAPLELSTETIEGVEVLTIDFTGADPSDELPVEPRLSIVVGDGHFYLGFGDFVREALTRDPSQSLASDERYGRALDIIGEEHAGILYVDLAATLQVIEAFLPPSAQEQIEAILPYIEPLDSVAASVSQQDGMSVASLILVVD